MHMNSDDILHMNSDDIPWEKIHHKSIIVRTNGQNTRTMIDFGGFLQEYDIKTCVHL